MGGTVGTLLGLAIALALLGVCAPLFSGRAENDFPRTGQLVEVEGIALHVMDQGQGPPIVALHGAWSAQQEISGTLAALLPGHRIIAVDRPGHGYSGRPAEPVDPARQAALIHAAVRKLGVERPVVLGFSFGGAVALAYALNHPADVSGLVLINPASHPWDGGVSWLYHLDAVPLAGWTFRQTLMPPAAHALLARAVRGTFAPSPVPALFHETAPTRLALRPRSYAANAADMRGLNAFLAGQVPRYASLDLPVLVLASEQDRSVGIDIHARRLVRALPRAELRTFDGAGHPLLYTHPAAVAAGVRDFVRSVRAAAG